MTKQRGFSDLQDTAECSAAVLDARAATKCLVRPEKRQVFFSARHATFHDLAQTETRYEAARVVNGLGVVLDAEDVVGMELIQHGGGDVDREQVDGNTEKQRDRQRW